MNSLLFALLRALRSHPWLRLLAYAFVLSSLGNGLTQVVVFGQLLRWQASPTMLTLAWLFATLPGFLGSLLGERLCRIFPPLHLLLVYELLGLLALILPWHGPPPAQYSFVAGGSVRGIAVGRNGVACPRRDL